MAKKYLVNGNGCGDTHEDMIVNVCNPFIRRNPFVILFCICLIILGACQKNEEAAPIAVPEKDSATLEGLPAITAKCIDGNLRVRQQPNLSAFVLGHLNPPDVVPVLHRSPARVPIGSEWDFWLNIKYEDAPAWSYSAWLVPNIPMEDVPVFEQVLPGWTAMGGNPPMDLYPFPKITVAEQMADRIFENSLPVVTGPYILQDSRLLHANLLVVNAETPNQSVSVSAVDPAGSRFDATLYSGKDGFGISDIQFKKTAKNGTSMQKTLVIPFYVPATFISGKWEISIALDTGQVIHQTVPVVTSDFSLLKTPVTNPFLPANGGRLPHRMTIVRGEAVTLYLANRPAGSQVPLVLYRGIPVEGGTDYYPVCGAKLITDNYGRGETLLVPGRDIPEGVYHFSWRDLANANKGYMDSMNWFETYVKE